VNSEPGSTIEMWFKMASSVALVSVMTIIWLAAFGSPTSASDEGVQQPTSATAATDSTAMDATTERWPASG